MATRHKILGLALAGVLAAAAPALAGKRDQSVKFAYDQAPENVDPFFNNVRIGVIIGQHVWDTLVYRDPNTGEYKGQLATAWRQVDDKTLEFDLRQGVKFHDGEEFDADDVVYTLNFVSKPENKVPTQSNVNWIDRAEKVDKYKVRVITKKVFPAAIEYLAGPVVMHPNDYYAKVGPKGQNEKPVGSGPYRVLNHVLGKSITLERNPDYFKESPKGQVKGVQKIEIRFIPDRQTQMAELLSGGMDFLMHVPKDQADQVKAVPNLQVVSGETMRIVFLQMNAQESSAFPMLKNLKVRQALNHAIDREAMVKNLVGEGSRVVNTICFPSQFGCTDEGAPRYPYDPQKAKQMLAEAGYPNGFDLPLYAYRERHQTEAMIGYLQAVGVKGNLNFLQYAAMRDQVRANKAGAGAPDLGLVLGQRRLGRDAGLFRLRRRRHCPRSGDPRSPCQGRQLGRPGRAQGGLQEGPRPHRGAGLHHPALFAAGLLRRHCRPRLQGLSGRDAALLGDDVEMTRITPPGGRGDIPCPPSS